MDILLMITACAISGGQHFDKEQLMYKTARHKRWRETVLRAAGYACESCARYGRARDGNHAHHIIPISINASVRYRRWNGAALCEECHNMIEPRTGEYNPPAWMTARIPAEFKITPPG